MMFTYRHVAAIGQVMDQPAATGCLVGIVHRPQERTVGVQVVVDLTLVPDVVAAGDHVDSAIEHLVGQRWRDAHPRGQVLTVGDDHVEVELPAKPG